MPSDDHLGLFPLPTLSVPKWAIPATHDHIDTKAKSGNLARQVAQSYPSVQNEKATIKEWNYAVGSPPAILWQLSQFKFYSSLERRAIPVNVFGFTVPCCIM
jgi:hypothetical protein